MQEIAPIVYLFWAITGLIAAFLAKKRGRSPYIWFLIGLFFSLFGIITLFLLPPKTKEQATPPPAPPKKSDAWLKHWYYLDAAHKSQGPIEFPDLILKWKENSLSENSYIWGEGMGEWRRLKELPDLAAEIRQN